MNNEEMQQAIAVATGEALQSTFLLMTLLGRLKARGLLAQSEINEAIERIAARADTMVETTVATK